MTKRVRHDPLGDEVAIAYTLTTRAQRLEVAKEFDQGRHRVKSEYAKLLQLNPSALLIAGLLEAEHNSICRENGRPKAMEYGKLLELAKDWRPVDKTLISVDKCPEIVDKYVENQEVFSSVPVDKMCITLDFSTVLHIWPDRCG